VLNVLSLRRKIVPVVIVAAVTVAGYLVYDHIEHDRIDAAWAQELHQFERDLPVGTLRPDVEKYLDARRMFPRLRNDRNYEVKIGEQAGDGLVCASWNVYLLIQFDSTDKVSDIRLRKVGRCL
jgi:hypothetical protein